MRDLREEQLHECEVAQDWETQLLEEQGLYWARHDSELTRLTMLQQGLENSEGLTEYHEDVCKELEYEIERRFAMPAPRDQTGNAAVPTPGRGSPAYPGLMDLAVPTRQPGGPRLRDPESA